MILRQTFSKPINGYWDYGAKSEFDWSIDGTPRQDSKGFFIKIGSWQANHWFNVAVGKTEKLTLSNARKKLLFLAKRAGKTCTFEYV